MFFRDACLNGLSRLQMMRTFYTGEAADINALENLSAAMKSFQSYRDTEGKKRKFVKVGR